MVRWPAGSHTRQCSSFSLCNLAPPGERAPEAKRKSANVPVPSCTILYLICQSMPLECEIIVDRILEDTCIWVWRLCVSCVASYMPRRKAMDSLRQLTMKFLEKDELAGYNFQALVLCLQSGLQVCRVHDRMAHMECNVFWCWLPHVCSNVLCRYAQQCAAFMHAIACRHDFYRNLLSSEVKFTRLLDWLKFPRWMCFLSLTYLVSLVLLQAEFLKPFERIMVECLSFEHEALQQCLSRQGQISTGH